MSFLRKALRSIANIATSVATAPVKAVKAGLQAIKKLVKRGEREIQREEPTQERHPREEAPIIDRNQQAPRTEEEDRQAPEVGVPGTILRPYTKEIHLRLADSPNSDDLEAMINLVLHTALDRFNQNW
jgi:hypothetical protein